MPLIILFGLLKYEIYGAEPDQVLVIYNKDWTEDQAGTEPGQDSKELADYYVKVHTDSKTGKKPWILGLTSFREKNGVKYLNHIAASIMEKSRDNVWGLKYKGKSDYSYNRKLPPQVVPSFGDAISGKSLKQASLTCVYGGIFVEEKDLERLGKKELEFMLNIADNKWVALESYLKEGKLNYHSFYSKNKKGKILIFDFKGQVWGKVKFRLVVNESNANQKTLLEQEFDLGEEDSAPIRMGKILKPHVKTAFFPRLLSDEDLRMHAQRVSFQGFVLPFKTFEKLDPKKILLAWNEKPDRKTAHILYGKGKNDPRQVYMLALRDGGKVLEVDTRGFNTDQECYFWLEGKDKEGNLILERKERYYSQKDFEFDLTGPDGIRDDQEYLNNIENPVKKFLENPQNALPDGTLLKDHILYFVVMRGMPANVPSLYGILRGSPGVKIKDLGTRTSITQRLSLLYYEPEKIIYTGRFGNRGSRKYHLLNELVYKVIGGQIAPYLLPEIFNGHAPSINEIPRFSSKLRKEKGKIVYAVTRIDAPSTKKAKAQIDGALWASRYLTPALGISAYRDYKAYNSLAAVPILIEKGFNLPPDVKSQKSSSDYCLFMFGVGGYGPNYIEDFRQPSKRGDGTFVPYLKGFYPGSWGYAIRSSLGWRRRAVPTQFAQYTRKMLDAGVTLSCGFTGKGHDTTHSRYMDAAFVRMVTSGYDYGECVLRATIYRNWVMEYFGDPLYCVDVLKNSKSPEIVLKDQKKVKISFEPVLGKFSAFVKVDIGHSGNTPTFGRVKCRFSSGKDSLEGENTFFSTYPETAVNHLLPNREYNFQMIIIDPYERVFDSHILWPEWKIKTPSTQKPVLIWKADFENDKERNFKLTPEQSSLLKKFGSIKCTFHFKKGNYDYRNLLSSNGREMVAGISLYRKSSGMKAGGALAQIHQVSSDRTKVIFEDGIIYTAHFFYRRQPVVREVYLEDENGNLHLAAANNHAPWLDFQESFGSLRAASSVLKLEVYGESPGPSQEGSMLYPHYFNLEKFKGKKPQNEK